MKTKYGEEIDPNDFPFAGQFGDYVRKTLIQNGVWRKSGN